MKKLATLALVLVLAVSAVVYLLPKQPVEPNNPTGAIPGNGVDDFFCVNGACNYSFYKNFNSASSTPCSYKTPNATSTLDFASVNIRTASSTATLWTLAYSKTSVSASTTPINGDYSLSSGAKDTFFFRPVASTTNAVIPPNSYLVWTAKGIQNPASSNLTLLNGSCRFDVSAN